MSKKQGAAKAEAVKVDPKLATTQKNKVRALEKHVKRYPSDSQASSRLQALKAGSFGAPRKAAKEPGKVHIIKIQFRDTIDRLEFTHDEQGNPYLDKEGKATKRYEDRISDRVGVREIDLLNIRAKIKGTMKFLSGLKESRKLPFEHAGVNMTIGNALNSVIDPNIVKLAKDQGLDLSRKAREAVPFDGKPGRKISVAEAVLQLINYKPRRHRPVDGAGYRGRQEQGQGRKFQGKPKPRAEAVA